MRSSSRINVSSSLSPHISNLGMAQAMGGGRGLHAWHAEETNRIQVAERVIGDSCK